MPQPTSWSVNLTRNDPEERKVALCKVSSIDRWQSDNNGNDQVEVKVEVDLCEVSSIDRWRSDNNGSDLRKVALSEVSLRWQVVE